MEAFKKSLSSESEKNNFASFVACVESLLQQEGDKLSEEQVKKFEESLVNYYNSHSGLDYTKPAVISTISKYLSSVLEEIRVKKPKEEEGSKIQRTSMKLNLAALQNIESFDGEGSFPDFKSCFETSLLLIGLQEDGTILTLSDELKASMLYIKLSEEVRQNINHLNNDDIKNYKKLVDVLEEIYPSKQLTQVQLRQKLNSLKRSDFKTIKEFCEAIEKLCKKIYAKCSREERQKLTIVEMCGKFDSTIHTAVENNAISQVDQAIEFIVSRTQRIEKNQHQKISNNSTNKNTTYVTDKECNYCKVKGHLKRDCEKLRLRKEKDVKITTKTETITALREIGEVNKCFITGELEKAVSVRVFVDAGASVSLISRSMADKIIQKGAFSCPNEICDISWGMGSNSKLNTYGSVITTVKFKREIHNLKFFLTDDKVLVKGMNCDVLLGADQQKRIGEVGINFNERICTLGKEKVSMLDYSGLKVISTIQKTLQFEDDETVEEEKKVKDSLMEKFPTLKDEEALGCCKYFCPDPEVIPHDGPPKFRRITVSQVQQNLLNEYTDKLISQGVLVPSSTSYVSSPMTIPKPNSNDYRTVTDLREINKLIRPHRYPSPTYIEITKSLVTSSLFSKIDLSNAFHQIPISKNFGKFLGVKTYKGLYEYARMPQGYKNASSVFQMILDRIVGKFEGVVIYIDDILLFTQNDISAHVQLIINVIEALVSHGLVIRLSKCQFCRTKVSYLGFVIGPSGTSINILATEPLRNRKFPRSKKELRSFLFAMNTYNRFIKNFALIAKPLTNMLSSKNKLVQGPKEVEAFEKLKECLLNCKTLCHPESGKDFYIESDASMEGVGAQLYQLSNNNEKNPIAFMSRKLSAKSKVLPPGYLELRGLITAVRSFEIYIQSEHTYALTDHKPLVSLMSTTQNPILLRWIQEIASFNVTVKYIEGDKNNFADYLSRSSPNTQQFDVLDVYAAHPNRINAILESMEDIPEDLLKELQKISTEIKIENGDIYMKRVNGIKHRWVRYVPPEKEVETAVRFHEIGHWHPDKGIKTMRLQVYFPCMLTALKNAYKECLACAKRNRKPEKKTEVVIVSTASYPFQQLAIDISGPFTRTDDGNLFLLNSICVFSRFLVSVPIADTKAKTIIDVLRKRIFSIFNTPESIRVDNAHYFDCEEFTFAMSTEDVTINFSTPYYSKSNCLVERSFATTQNLVSKLLLSIDKSTTIWDQVVDYVVRYYNASVHETLNESPYFIVFLRDPHHLGWIETTDVKSYGEYIDKGLELMKTAYEIVNQHRLRVRMKSKIEEDMKRNPPQIIKAGDPILVQLPTPNKFEGLYKGPFICKKVENNIVHYSKGTRRNQTFKAHVTKVKKFEGTSE